MAGLSSDQQSKMAHAGAEVLQNFVVQHEHATEKMIQLDEYILELTMKAIDCMKRGDKGKALLLMHRRCVADGMKHVYRQYRLKKWQQIQKLVRSIVSVMNPDSSLTEEPPIQLGSTQEEDQMEKYVQTMMVAQCNFSRYE